MDKYILDGKTPVKEPDVLKWGKWFETYDRHVGSTDVTNKIYVSTVFLGIDHNLYAWFGDGSDGHYYKLGPHLFETMIFGGALDGYQERYSTWEEAEEGHRLAVGKASHAVWQKLRKCKGKRFDSSFNRMLESRNSMQRLTDLFGGSERV